MLNQPESRMNEKSSVHISVLFEEVLAQLAPQKGGVFVDGTLGGGGHCRALAEAVGDEGQIIALDHDAAAIARAERELTSLPISVCQSNFCEAPEVLDEIGIEKVDGVLLDLGLSSDQLADDQRGFSFIAGGELDLRFDVTQGEPAHCLVNRLTEEHLANLIYEFGEERLSRRIARVICQRRRERPITDAIEFAELVRSCVPKPRDRSRQRIDPATRTFQALRIAVNEELKSLDIALQRMPDYLKPGGRFAIISFHSLEDRRVKNAFRDDPRLNNLTRKPIIPSETETFENPRARSAKLRVAERVA
jgi:16S rRNA (cytosine1402-N4)-methyltransferase